MSEVAGKPDHCTIILLPMRISRRALGTSSTFREQHIFSWSSRAENQTQYPLDSPQEVAGQACIGP